MSGMPQLPREFTQESMGITQEGKKSIEKAMKLLGAFLDAHETPFDVTTKDELRSLMEKFPPEALAPVICQQMDFLRNLVRHSQITEFGVFLVTRKSEPRFQLSYIEPFVERIRVIAKQVRDEILVRAAEGWPEWDWERGCVVGAAPKTDPSIMSLFDDLEGIDWEGLGE